MKIKVFKLIISLFFLTTFLLVFVVLYDLAKFDSSYINRKSLTFSINNLNSHHTKKIYTNYLSFYHYITDKIFSKNNYKDQIEDKSLRTDLPETKIIFGKQNGFLPGKKISEIEKNFSNWPRSHGGYSSMRFSSLDIINKANINELEVAWIFNSEDGKKGIQANPVVYDGLVYFPTPGNHIICLDGKSGKEIWRYKAKKGYNVAKRGLLVWKDKKNNILKLFFTNDDTLISLDAKTGLPINNFGKNGIIKIGSSPIPPVIIKNQLIVATFRPSVEVYDVYSGKLLWKYFLRKEKESDFNGGNPWGGISADIQKSIVYLTTGNPKPNFVGVTRSGQNLFANSIVAIDIKNKKKLWHFQETCHDIWNHDIPSSPILTTININNKRIDVVVAVTKLGNTLILERYSGKPIFDYKMKLAPRSKIPGEKTCDYQPSLLLPEPFAKNIFKKKDISNLSAESKNYILSIVEKSNYGFFQPHELNKDTIQFGENGGAQWTGASIDPYKNIMYVTANNIPYLVGIRSYKNKKIIKYVDKKAVPLRDLDGYPGSKPPWGTISAINLNNGKMLWQKPLGYYEELKAKGIITGTENYGGATATSGGLVFASGTLDKLIRAFDSDTGEELWSHKLPYIGSAPPTSYKVENEQYIVIPSSGGTSLKTFYGGLVELGDAIVAFKIKK